MNPIMGVIEMDDKELVRRVNEINGMPDDLERLRHFTVLLKELIGEYGDNLITEAPLMPLYDPDSERVYLIGRDGRYKA